MCTGTIVPGLKIFLNFKVLNCNNNTKKKAIIYLSQSNKTICNLQCLFLGENMRHLLNNFHTSNYNQYNTNDPFELQTSANHIVISRFRNLQER